jgi:ribonuclease D
MIIESDAALAPVVARLRADGLAALDTEFVWTRTYFPRLGIVQLAAADGTAWVADAAAAAGPALAGLIADPRTLKILHDARQDLTLLAAVAGVPPRNIFDTRLAAGFAGLATTVSLKQLLHDLLEVDLPKTETRTDWCRRPLSAAQLDYALDDVRHLGRLRGALLARVAERGATAWLEEDLRLYDDPGLYAPPDPDAAWQRIRGGSRLAPHDQELLRPLAAHRERRAMEWNLPRSWVIDDESLIETARRRPVSPEAVRPRHRLDRERLRTLCRELCHIVRDAAGTPAPEAGRSVGRRADGALKARVDAALAFLRQRGAELRIDPALLGSRAEVMALVEAGIGPEHPLGRGWRREVAGAALTAHLAASAPPDLFD